MKKNNFKRLLSFLLAAALCLGMLPAVFAQDADEKNIDYAIANPYADVDWETYGQYKASLHNHSIVSDGNNDMNYVIETYYSMGYDILAITDHGTVDSLRQRQRRPRNAQSPLRHRAQSHLIQQLPCQLLVCRLRPRRFGRHERL